MISKPDKLQQWLLYTPLGRYVLMNEKIFYHNTIQSIFGYYSIQIGLPQINFLQNSKISNHFIIDNNIKCDVVFLPFAENSIDLIICPHTLEFTPNYHHFLQECYRVLIPEGKIIITGFNQTSFFNLFKKNIPPLKNGKLIKLNYLKHQLQNLNFQIIGGKFFSYRPLINNKKILLNLAWMEKAGDRWFPTFANNYALVAIKELLTTTRIETKKNLKNSLIKPQLYPAKLTLYSKKN